MDKIKTAIKESIAVKERILNDDDILTTIKAVAELTVMAYRNGCKVLAAGNGGSAADAQHFAAEFVGRFYYNRPPLSAIALTTDTSALTAIGNDYGYDYIFSRQVEANAVKGDILFAISTSGNSVSIINAIRSAKNKGVAIVGLTGEKPSKMDDMCDYIFKVPSADTPRIQEGHELIEHIICQLVEEQLFPR